MTLIKPFYVQFAYFNMQFAHMKENIWNLRQVLYTIFQENIQYFCDFILFICSNENGETWVILSWCLGMSCDSHHYYAVVKK